MICTLRLPEDLEWQSVRPVGATLSALYTIPRGHDLFPAYHKPAVHLSYS